MVQADLHLWAVPSTPSFVCPAQNIVSVTPASLQISSQEDSQTQVPVLMSHSLDAPLSLVDSTPHAIVRAFVHVDATFSH